MRFRAAALSLIVFAYPLHAQEASYLTEPKRFETALAQITTKAGSDIDVGFFAVDDDELVVIGRVPGSGGGLVRWYVKAVELFGLHVNQLTGPEPVDTSGRNDVEGSLFRLSEIPLDRLPVILGRAERHVRFDSRARSGTVRIQRKAAVDDPARYGEVGWTIALKSYDESATVYTDAGGKVLGADIGETRRWRERHFHIGSGWPFDRAQDGFLKVVGRAPVVRSIVITEKDVTMTATAPDRPDLLRAWVWDGSTHDPAVRVGGTVDPDVQLDSPTYSLDDIDLSRVDALKDVAKQAAGPDAMFVDVMRIVAAADGTAAPQVVWDIDVEVSMPGLGPIRKLETASIRLNRDGVVAAVATPAENVAAAHRATPEGVVQTIAAFRQHFGDDMRIYDMHFREDTATVKRPHPSRPGMTINAMLKEDGVSDWSEFPLMMETEDDLFTLGALAGIDAALIASIREQAVAAIGIDGAEVERMSLSSGAPFWRDPKGRPLFDVRVGVPPDHRIGGYAVFSMDGKLVDAVK